MSYTSRPTGATTCMLQTDYRNVIDQGDYLQREVRSLLGQVSTLWQDYNSTNSSYVELQHQYTSIDNAFSTLHASYLNNTHAYADLQSRYNYESLVSAIVICVLVGLLIVGASIAAARLLRAKKQHREQQARLDQDFEFRSYERQNISVDQAVDGETPRLRDRVQPGPSPPNKGLSRESYERFDFFSGAHEP
ncbi:hypothetical protein F5Y18DRAFT_433412 [Xylariaceae sp. FL1019]|nr:hypothetical protein F5Y18DRAFT_433412 [Xylariaceae sp. FL1019]